LRDWAEVNGMELYTYTSRSNKYSLLFNNENFETIIKQNKLNKVKYIPKPYKVNDEKTRLEFLAGIIDSCGTLKFKDSKSEQFEIIIPFSCDQISDDIVYISKSCGLITKLYHNYKNQTVILIDGNLSKIPTKLKNNRSNKSYMINKYSNISVEYLGKGDYVGWYIDKNERFLLGDFTVTHNTRNMLGQDCASSRYIFTSLRNWVFDCYIEQDFDILEYAITNGEECEYKYFLPIIPMQLINGSVGIATGYSTNIPQYSPYDIIKWLIYRIKKQSKLDNEIKIKPWYAGFKGEVLLSSDETKFTTKGLVKRSRDSWIIEEIPISKSIHKYKNFLDDLLEEKSIQDYSNLSQPNSPLFLVKCNNILDEKKLNLTSNHSLKNLVLLDKDNKPVVYNNIYGILEDWFDFRILKYEQRKQNEIKKLNLQISKLNMKIKFIDLVLKDEIVIFKQKKENILQSMKKHELDEDLLRMSMVSFTQDEIDSLIKVRDEKQEYLTKYINTKVEQIWMTELSNLLQSINQYYNDIFDSKITENATLSENKSMLINKKRK